MMARKHTDIQELQGREQELRTRIARDLEELQRCQEDLLQATRIFEREYALEGDRYPITRYAASVRHAHGIVRASRANLATLRVASYQTLMDTLKGQEEREKARRERMKARVERKTNTNTDPEPKVTHAS